MAAAASGNGSRMAVQAMRVKVIPMAAAGGSGSDVTGPAAASTAAAAGRFINLYYHKNAEQKEAGRLRRPTVIYTPGFMSMGRATKSQFMASHCASRGVDYVCYDPEGVVDLSDPEATPPDSLVIDNYDTLKFSHWFDDCNTALHTVQRENEVAVGGAPVVLVGSSMGAWIALKNMLAQPFHRNPVKGLLLIAPSINFMWSKYLMWHSSMSAEDQQKLDAGHTVVLPSPYGRMPVSKAFAEQSKAMELDTSRPIQVPGGGDCPVRILHGMQDQVVPFQRGVELAELIDSRNLDLTLRKSGDHRLSQPEDLQLLGQTLDKLLSICQE